MHRKTFNLIFIRSSIPVFVFIFCSLRLFAQDGWERIETGSSFDLWDVAFADSLSGTAVGNYGAMLKTTDGGKSWTQKISKSQLAFRGVRFLPNGIGLAVGLWSTIYRSADRGDTWEQQPATGSSSYPGIATAGTGTVWISGDNGSIRKSTDAGKTWKEVTSGTTKIIDAISFADTLNGWCSSSQGALLHSADGGNTWMKQSTGAMYPVTTVCAVSSTECWIAGYAGLISRTTDAGKTWQTSKAYDTRYSHIHVDKTGTGWAVGQHGSLVHKPRAENEWKLAAHAPVGTLNSLSVLSDTTIITVGSGGAIYRLYRKL